MPGRARQGCSLQPRVEQSRAGVRPWEVSGLGLHSPEAELGRGRGPGREGECDGPA